MRVQIIDCFNSVRWASTFVLPFSVSFQAKQNLKSDCYFMAVVFVSFSFHCVRLNYFLCRKTHKMISDRNKD